VTPTNQQIAEYLKRIGSHLVELEGFLHAVAGVQAQQYKLIASKVPDFTPEEDAVLRAAAQRCLSNLEKLSPLRKQFKQDVEIFSKLV
jgi:hypothetical protein